VVIQHVDPIGVAATGVYARDALMKVIPKDEPVMACHTRSPGTPTVKAEITGSQTAETSPKSTWIAEPLIYTGFPIKGLREQAVVLK
jgi:hypothetical protein